MAERIAELEDSLRAMLSWADTGTCSDCDPYREAPSCIVWTHAHDCAHLEVMNRALVLLGEDPIEGHRFVDAKQEMRRAADVRWYSVLVGYLVAWGDR